MIIVLKPVSPGCVGLQLVTATGPRYCTKRQRYPRTTCGVFSSVIESGIGHAPGKIGDVVDDMKPSGEVEPRSNQTGVFVRYAQSLYQILRNRRKFERVPVT